jgi:putative ABC transport system permease protein
VRTALGAGRGRLFRGILSESVLLALAGGIAAGFFGIFAAHGLRALLLPDYNWALPAIGPLPAIFAAAVSLVIGIVTGLVPATLAGRRETLGALRAGIQRGRGGRSRVRSLLVALQVAVSVLLFVGTGLFVRSFARAATENHGMPLQRMLEAELSLEGNDAAQAARLDEVLAAVRRVSGVAGVTAVSAAPMRRLDFSTFHVDDRDSAAGAMNYAVPLDFFAVSGMRALDGRRFTSADQRGSEPVAIVDQVFQAKVMAGQSPVGHCLRIEHAPACVRIVGVVPHVRATGLQDQPMPQFYRPLTQVAAPPEYAIMVVAADHPSRLIAPVAQAIARVIPEFPASAVRSYEDMLDPQIRPWRVGVILFSLAAVLALLLSSVGTYAVMAFAVRQRNHEFGVRRALGAGASHILGIVVGEGVGVAGAGIVLGLGAAFAAGKLVLPLLYKQPARDPVVFGLAGVFLLAAALVAALAAGIRALGADPRQALQAD